MNRSKNIGTSGETGVVRFARENGFLFADRLTMKGQHDEGDVLLCPGLVVEVKAGASAHRAAPEMVVSWLVQTETERQNGGADLAFLVVARRGYSPARAGHWRAIIPEPWRLFVPDMRITSSDTRVAARVKRILDCPIEMSYRQALIAIRHAGWGDPLD